MFRKPFWITNRICALRGNIFSARIFKMCMHESRSEGALRSQVLGIRLSRRIMIQNAPLSHVSKARFERALRSQRVKLGFQIRKGSESQESKTAFGMRFSPLWTEPVFGLHSHEDHLIIIIIIIWTIYIAPITKFLSALHYDSIQSTII